MEREQIYAYPIMPRYRLDDTNIDICELDDAAMFIAQVGYPNSDALIKAINDAYRDDVADTGISTPRLKILSRVEYGMSMAMEKARMLAYLDRINSRSCSSMLTWHHLHVYNIRMGTKNQW